MKYWVGIDLGSTTTKAVLIGEHGDVLGRGITNSRSNYRLACDVALAEAVIDARFALVAKTVGSADESVRGLVVALECAFRKQQYLWHLDAFARIARGHCGSAGRPAGALERVLERMRYEADVLFAAGEHRKSDFFRDLAASRFLPLAEEAGRRHGLEFDWLAGLFEKSMIEVENLSLPADGFALHAGAAVADLTSRRRPDRGRESVAGRAVAGELERAVDRAASVPLEWAGSVGTGYGRAILPFPKDRIRSEILCHGMGAHSMFPATRTVLDIGGQDTKAIQVDGGGIVTSFQMNDRCAAGCGRYLGYIADELSLGLHELGPLACRSGRPARINSTCTVFAGVELRERLSLGERQEDILAGLHRAIILRAMALLARSGGVFDQFTFTGGVVRNSAAVGALARLVEENYGRLSMNVSPESIYTGALGAALFARREGAPASAAGGAEA